MSQYNDVNRDTYLSAMFNELNASSKMVDLEAASRKLHMMVLGSDQGVPIAEYKNASMRLVAVPKTKFTVNSHGLMVGENGNVIIPPRAKFRTTTN